MSEQTSCYAVGDELAFDCRNHLCSWEIAKITKITPSGRMKCGRWELNPDLSIRGRHGYFGPYRGQPVTDEIRREVLRAKNLRIVKNMKWEELHDDQLAEVVRLVQSSPTI